MLADGPDLAPAAVDRVLEAWRQRRHAGRSPPRTAAARGHPLVLAREAWADVPDEGLRSQLVVLVPCDDLGAPGDVDYARRLPPR